MLLKVLVLMLLFNCSSSLMATGLKAGSVLTFFPAADYSIIVGGEDYVVSPITKGEGIVIKIYSSCFSTSSRPTVTNLSPLSTVKLYIALNLDGGTQVVEFEFPAFSMVKKSFWSSYAQQKGVDGKRFSELLRKANAEMVGYCKKKNISWCKTVTSGRSEKNFDVSKKDAPYQVAVVSNIRNIQASGIGNIVELTIPDVGFHKGMEFIHGKAIDSVRASQVAVPSGRYAGQTGPLQLDYDVVVSAGHRSVEMYISYPGHEAFCDTFQ